MDDLYVFLFCHVCEWQLGCSLGVVWQRVEKHLLECSEVFRMFKECVLLCSSSLITMLFWYVQLKQGHKFCSCIFMWNRL